MNIKKRLEQEAKSTHQKILEEGDRCFLSSLREKTPKSKSHFYHWKAWLTGVFCIVSAALIFLCAVFLIPSEERIVYYEKNFQSSASDIDTLNADLKDFQISIGEMLRVTNVERTIDKPSGDLLFYEMTLQTSDTRIQTRITIVCNQNYYYDDQLKVSYQQAQLSDFTVLYYIESSVNLTFQCQSITAYAKIEGEHDRIYITDYQEISIDENGTLLQFIQDLIQVKE